MYDDENYIFYNIGYLNHDVEKEFADDGDIILGEKESYTKPRFCTQQNHENNNKYYCDNFKIDPDNSENISFI